MGKSVAQPIEFPGRSLEGEELQRALHPEITEELREEFRRELAAIEEAERMAFVRSRGIILGELALQG